MEKNLINTNEGGEKMKEVFKLKERIEEVEKILFRLEKDKQAQERLDKQYGKGKDSTLMTDYLQAKETLRVLAEELEKKEGKEMSDEDTKKVFSKDDPEKIQGNLDNAIE